MKAGIGICSKTKKVFCAGLGVFALSLVASAAPQRVDISRIELKGMLSSDGADSTKAIIWLDEATRARGSTASGGTAEALIFHQPHDSGFGFFEKSYTDGPLWYCRMIFGNGFVPGGSITAYELRIFHSSSDDVNFGPADYGVELWDGDPLSETETVCATGGVSAPIPGTQGIIAGVPYNTTVQGRVELAAKVIYDCDRVWMAMTSLNGCRAAWRISWVFLDCTWCKKPDVGRGNGRGLLTGCESGTFANCPTDTGYAAGFCCGSEGTCSGTGDPCGFAWADCPAGETCDGAEDCDHSALDAFGDFLDPCSTGAAAVDTFCGPGPVAVFIANIDVDDSEFGYVGSIFSATETTLSVVPVSVDAGPSASGSGAGVISLGGDEVVLQDGDHVVWMEVMMSNWDPSRAGVKINGYQAAFDAEASFVSGVQGALVPFISSSCGECDDDSSACFSHDDCTFGSCSGTHCDDDGSQCAADADCGECETSGDPCASDADCAAGELCDGPGLCVAGSIPCHIPLDDCASGETCDGPALCVEVSTGDDDCKAALGDGAVCGQAGDQLGTGACSWADIDSNDPRFVFRGLPGFPAIDVSTIDARLGFALLDRTTAPSPFPAEGLYSATVAIAVPADAKGTFTIALKPFPDSVINDFAGPLIPLLGVVPGKITVQTGACCFNLQLALTGGQGCLDGNQTAGSCAQLAGITQFSPGESCSEELCEVCKSSEPSTYEDFDACTDNACIEGVATFTTRVCVDGLVCTDDDCDPDDGGGLGVGCFYTAVDIDDGLACTIDDCQEPGGITHTPVDVSDGIACTFDHCDEPDGAIFHDDLSSVPNLYACPTGDPVADDCPGATGDPELISTACTDGFCHCILCFTDVPCSNALACRADIEIAWSSDCAAAGDKVTANVVIGDSANGAAVPINGGQFVLHYDSSCMSLNSVNCPAPYDFEIYRAVSDGRIQLACGVNPFLGVNGPPSGSGAVLASANFKKSGQCSSCSTSFSSTNPDNTAYTDVAGQPICADIVADGGFVGIGKLSLTVPGDVKTNADCDARTASVTWDAPAASDSCGDAVDLNCSGSYPDESAVPSAVVMNGGEHPQGTTTYSCTASNAGCGSSLATAGWTVTVNSDQTIDVTVQLSPVLAGDLERCIKFTLYEDCTAPPTVIERNLFFGGMWDFVGHFTDTIKAPKGQYTCITAQDNLHSLRACATLSCSDGSYSAVFKGDPFFPGGNWLQNGNLDGWKKDNPAASHNVIDIYDFGSFMALYLTTPAVDTPCNGATREVGHADINGDGIVDALDLAFVLNNFLTSSKDCCCGAAAGVTVPRTEVSVRELREMGMGELAIADLDGNGLVNLDDITAFMAGDRPVKVAPVRGVKGSGVRSR